GTNQLVGVINCRGGAITGRPTIEGTLNWTAGSISNSTVNIAGNVNWSGGQLVGTLNILEQSQLDIAGNPVMTGVLNNAGRITLPAATSLEMDSAAQINNSGVFECFSLTPFTYKTGTRPVFNHTGVFRVLGVGTTLFTTAVEFQQRGVLEMASGDVDFASGVHSFNDSSVITGPGLVQI